MRNRLVQHRAVLGLTLAAALAYATLSVARHETFRSTGFDLGLFDQVVWHLSNLDAPASSLKGLDSIFGDHFSPVLLLCAPLYWVWSDPDALLIAQAILVAAAAIPIHAFAKTRVGHLPALGIAAGYLLFGGVQAAIWFDFHEVAFAPLPIALAILLADRGRWTAATIAACTLLLIKEDMSFLVVAFGVYFALLGRRRLGLGVATAGFAWYFLVTSVVIPHFSDGASYTYWSYTQLGPNAPHALANVIKAPWKLLDVGLSPNQKIKTTAYLFGAFGGLSLLSPIVVLTLPLLAERMLSTNAAYWTLHGHYSLTIAPVLALAAADGLPRAVALLAPRRIGPSRSHLLAGGAIAALGVALVPAFPLRHLAEPDAYRAAPGMRTADAALDAIPDAASVAATNHLIAHLTHRDDAVLFGPAPSVTDYVIADTTDTSKAAVFPNPDARSVLELLVANSARYSDDDSAGTIVVQERRR